MRFLKGTHAWWRAVESCASRLTRAEGRRTFARCPVARIGHALAVQEWSSLLQLPLFHLLLFAPAGAFAVAALVEARISYSGALRRVAAGGAVLALLVELAGGMASHPIVWGSVVVHAACG